MYYEAHITMEHVPDINNVKTYLASYAWHYSCISGDPDLGEHVFKYATKHFGGNWSMDDVKEAVNSMAGELLTKGCSVVRRKIEMIVYDERTVTH